MYYDIDKDDLRWCKRGDSSERTTYLEALRAMCKCYGGCSGRWHDNEFWYKTLRQSYSLIERDAKKKVFEIENEAEVSLEQWKQYQ